MSVLNEDAALVRATESITQMYYGITAQSSYLKRRDLQVLLKLFSFNWNCHARPNDFFFAAP